MVSLASSQYSVTRTVSNTAFIQGFRAGEGATRRCRSIILLLLLMALGACSTTPPQVRSIIVNGSQISGASNQVQIIRGGVATAASVGAGLEVGDEITTGPGAKAVLQLENGAVEVILMENTEVQISSIFVKVGEVFARVIKDIQGVFEVESDYGVAGVEGTEFMVKMQPDGQYRCVVLEGEVRVTPRVTAGGRWQPISIGTREEMTGLSGNSLNRRTLSRQEYNAHVKRINEIERIYRPQAMQLLVPDVTGITEDEAQRILGAQNLSVGAVSRKVTGDAKVGQVLSQSPAVGRRIKPSGSVRLTVEAIPTTVPSVTANDLRSAERVLARARLKMGTINEQITGNNKVGNIFRQQPTSGQRVPVDSEVDLWVEGDSVRVPSVLKTDVAAARRTLANARLKVGTESRRLVESAEDGTVLEQSVAARALVKPGTAVNLVVAERGVKIPNLKNNTRAVASRVLSRAGLKMGSSISRSSSAKEGTVIEQSPRSGSLVRPGTAVDIVTARGCRVPSVVKDSTLTANSKIRKAGLVPVIRSTGKYNSDQVLRQSPKAGSAARCGSSVYLDRGTSIG